MGILLLLRDAILAVLLSWIGVDYGSEANQEFEVRKTANYDEERMQGEAMPRLMTLESTELARPGCRNDWFHS